MKILFGISAQLAALVIGIVYNAQYITFGIVAVGIIHDGQSRSCKSLQLSKPPAQAVKCIQVLRTIAISHINALLEFVITQLFYIAIAAALLHTFQAQHFSRPVIMVFHFFSIRIGYLLDTTPCVVFLLAY